MNNDLPGTAVLSPSRNFKEPDISFPFDTSEPAVRTVHDRENTHRLSLQQIAKAAEIIDRTFLNSSEQQFEALNEAVGCRVTLKLETANPIRSFKGRGADFFFQEAARRGDVRRVVCASAGNFGQALTYAGRRRGREVTVFASSNANPMKIAMMRELGADLRIAGADFDAAKATARAFALEENAWMVEDGQEPEISEGAGSIAVELLRNGVAFDHVLLPLGNGALLNGCARWFKAVSPATAVWGVCANNADSMMQSFYARRVVETNSAKTIADGIAVRVPIPAAVLDMYECVDEVFSVDDEEIIASMRLLYKTTGLIVEPSGAVGLAGALTRKSEIAGKNIVLLLTGANIAADNIQRWIYESANDTRTVS